MRILLTGITGNLGYEVALDLIKRGITVVPIVRPSNIKLSEITRSFTEVVINDLLADKELNYSGLVDCIVHCAGNINFKGSGDTNQKMTSELVKLAKKLNIPLYLVSTAYIYRPSGTDQNFNNSYELDKFRSEQILINSGLEYGIFRPSVLVGNTSSGEVQNFSGYYNLVKAFHKTLTSSKEKGKKMRFPILSGKSNIVPVDQVAFYIGNEVQNLNLNSFYLTNPDPPEASWLTEETLSFFNLDKYIDRMEISLEEFGKLDLTNEEECLHKFVNYYYPYLSISYDFPPSICKVNLIDHNYLIKALSFLKSSNFLTHE